MQTRKGSGLRDTIPGGFYIGHNNSYADERSRYPKVSGEVNGISDAVAGRVPIRGAALGSGVIGFLVAQMEAEFSEG